MLKFSVILQSVLVFTEIVETGCTLYSHCTFIVLYPGAGALSQQLTPACTASVKVLVQAWNLFVSTQKKLLGIFKNLMKESLARYC